MQSSYLVIFCEQSWYPAHSFTYHIWVFSHFLCSVGIAILFFEEIFLTVFWESCRNKFNTSGDKVSAFLTAFLFLLWCTEMSNLHKNVCASKETPLSLCFVMSQIPRRWRRERIFVLGLSVRLSVCPCICYSPQSKQF